MDKDQAIQTIIFECEDIDGFLVKFRSQRDFNDEQFQTLVEAIRIYRDAIIGENFIHRRVAGALFYFVMEVGSITQFYERYDLPDKEKIANAYAELSGLVESIYDI